MKFPPGKLSDSWKRVNEFPRWYKLITKEFRIFLCDETLTDVEFICWDGVVKAHRYMLLAASPYFRKMLKSDPKIYLLEETIHVSMPDVGKSDLETFLQSIYLGAFPLDSERLTSCIVIMELFHVFDNDGELVLEDSGTFEESAEPDVLSGSRSSIGTLRRLYEDILKEPMTDAHTANNMFTELGKRRRGPPKGSSWQKRLGRNTSLPLLLVKPEEETCCRDRSCPECSKEWERLKQLSEQKMKNQNLLEIREQQCTLCRVCFKPAYHHRSANGTGYQCCSPECQKAKPFLTARGFNAHSISLHEADIRNQSVYDLKSCPLCFKTMAEHENLEVTDAQGKPVHRCCMCTVSRLRPFRFFRHVNNHLMRPFTCKSCSRSHATIEELDLHIKRYQGQCLVLREDLQELKPEPTPEGLTDGKFSCDKCSQSFKLKWNLSKHMSRHMPPIQCPKCFVIQDSDNYEKIHKNICHVRIQRVQHPDRTIEEKFECDLCGADGFKSVNKVNLHIRRNHHEIFKYKCDQCKTGYSTRSSYLYHLAFVHNEGNLDLPKCKLCNKTLSSMSKLKNHIAAVHNQEKKFQCRFCDKRFGVKFNLNAHEKIHGTLAGHFCSLCQKWFKEESELKAHKDHHHPLTVVSWPSKKRRSHQKIRQNGPQTSAEEDHHPQPAASVASVQETTLYEVVYDASNPNTVVAMDQQIPVHTQASLQGIQYQLPLQGHYIINPSTGYKWT